MPLVTPLPLRWMEELYARFSAMFADRFTKGHSDTGISIWYEEWAEGLQGITGAQIKQALAYVRLNCKWAPSLAEFRQYCDQANGVPSKEAAYQDALNKRLTHPIIDIVRRKITSWCFSNDTEAQLAKKFDVAYTEALNEFRQHPADCWRQLEGMQKQPALPPPEISLKHMAEDEKVSWNQRLDTMKQKAAADQANGTKLEIPAFGPHETGKRLEYLGALSELDAMFLCTKDAYDRIRYLRQAEGMHRLENRQC